MIKGIGSVKKQQLLEIYKSPQNIYNATKEELLKIDGIGETIANSILNNENKQIIDKHIQYMYSNQIDIISLEDKEYPQLLKQIYDFPISLYIKGNKNILNDYNIAIVGCREASSYGKRVAKYFSYNLAKKGKNIVSGLAKGIDSYSHLGTICLEKENNAKEKYGKTIAVLGNGLNTIYPSNNIGLANEIINCGGAIITEYPLGTKPEKMNFPARNRIISGMSQGVLVIEAREKSGSLITVDFALEQGRDVFVVPGNINSANSVGTNDLIKQGGKLVSHYNDIV